MTGTSTGGNWYKCPVTGARLLRLTPESTVENTPVYCRKCRREHLPVIREGRVVEEDRSR